MKHEPIGSRRFSSRKPRAASWQQFWEMMALSADPLLAADLIQVTNLSEKYESMCRELQSLLELTESDRFLNVGCGAGLFESWLDGAVREIVSMDLAWNMLIKARALNGHRAPVTLLQATATALPFADHTFDRVLANSVTHYLSAAELSAMLAEFRRVVKPGGRIVIGDVEEPAPPLIERLRRLARREGMAGVLRRSFSKLLGPVVQLYQHAREYYLVARGRLHPVEKPAPIIRHRREDLLRLAADQGFEGQIVEQGAGALFSNRFNMVLTVKTDRPAADG